MAGASPSQLSPSVLGAVQWTLVGIEVLVLAYVVAWLGRNSRLGRLVRPFRGRTTLSGESAVELDRARPARLVSAGGGTSTTMRSEPETRPPSRPPSPTPSHTPSHTPSRPPSRTPRSLRLTRTPVRGTDTVAHGRQRQVPAALHCPGCGTLLARGEAATRLVTRCTGCDRRVAARLDGERVVVTLEERTS